MIRIVTHTAPDGDALGAVFAAHELLASAGQLATVHLFGDLPRWFPAVHQLLGAPPYETTPVTEGPVWLFDASSLVRCGAGNVAEGLAIDVLFDHHPDESTPAAWLMICPEMSSTCEMLVRCSTPDLLDGASINPQAAGWLYLGLRTDSLSFATDTTSAHTHDVASWLIEQGAPHIAIAAAVRRSMPSKHLGFQTEVLGRATWLGDALLVVADQLTMERYGVNKNDVKSVFSLTGQLADVGLAAVLVEMPDGRTILSLRSPGSGRAQALARHFGGGGHPSAAGANVARGLHEVRHELLMILGTEVHPCLSC